MLKAITTALLLSMALTASAAPTGPAVARARRGNSPVGDWKTATNLRGVSYSPSIKNFCGQNTPAASDSDWTSDSFQALWGVDPTPGVTSRNDLKNLADAGINVLHVYDWNPALWQPGNPSSGHMRNHMPFLDYAHSLGMSVVVPVSNWVFKGNMQYADAVAQTTVSSVQQADGSIHPAVFAWGIANEPDDAGAGIAMSDVAAMITKIAAIDTDAALPFTVPFTTGVHPSATPAGSVFGGAQELQKLLPAAIWNDRFFVGTNAFQNLNGFNSLILDGYLAAFPDAATRPPFWVSESGFTSSSDQAVVNTYLPVLCRMTSLMSQGSNQFSLMGFSLFEYEAEFCKNNADGGPEYFFGLNFASGDISAAHQPKTKAYYDGTLTHAMVQPTAYPVPELKPREMWTKAAQLLSDPTNNFAAVCGAQ